MGLNDTPSAERVHIGFFGRRNAGKSSVVNAVTGQELSIVSAVQGTTTDPVLKAMELLPLGPVVIIDTPGIDDEGTLGDLRVRRTKRVLNQADCAVLVVDAAVGLTREDRELIALFRHKQLPYLVAFNKCDLETAAPLPEEEPAIAVSAKTGEHIWELKERIAQLVHQGGQEHRLLGDLVETGDIVVLVVPIDGSAPKGRLILPQQQAIRDLLEAGAMPIVTRDTEYALTLEKLGTKPKLTVTDSQAFGRIAGETPPDIPLTSFSILMARYKGFLGTAVGGASAIRTLQDGDCVLISEGCTHHRQCEDIGTVKLPRWLAEYTGKQLKIETSSGRGFPEDLYPYRLVIHCGGCMLNERELRFRQKCAEDAGVPFTNYGTAIACMKGILPRALEILPEYHALLENKLDKTGRIQ